MAQKKKAEEKQEIIIATVTGGRLNVRPEKSTDKDPVAVLDDGAEVEVLEIGKTWCRIRNGYVMRQYLTF